MPMLLRICLLAALLPLGVSLPAAYAQGGIWGKVKEKAKQAGVQVAKESLGFPSKSPWEQAEGPGAPPSTGSRGRASNTKGSLKVTPPNVEQEIGKAEQGLQAKQYQQARDAVRQAMMGVELQIGQQLLDGLPKEVAGLPVVAQEDLVTSQRYGWDGMLIKRLYEKGDQQLYFDLVNNSLLATGLQYYLSGQYGGASSDQDWKQVNVQGQKGVLEFSEGHGYKLSIPLGASTIVVLEGVNFESEEAILQAAAALDLQKIKKTLGEQ